MAPGGGGGRGSCGFSRFGLAMEGGEGDLGGVKDAAALLWWNGADEDAVGRAGDKVADTFEAGKQGIALR